MTKTITIRSIEEAIERLVERQIARGGIPDPARLHPHQGDGRRLGVLQRERLPRHGDRS